MGYVGNQIDLFTREVFCSPVFPGTTLKRVDTELSFEAPWWAPDSMKETAFEKFCSQDVSPTTLEWKHNQKECWQEHDAHEGLNARAQQAGGRHTHNTPKAAGAMHEKEF